MATCLVIQHVEIEGPAMLGTILVAAGAHLEFCRVYEGDPLPPDAAGLSGVVVMGGPMSAAEGGFPGQPAELQILRDAMNRGIPTLGICLGAQLLALAAGGRVFAGPAGAEIGWGRVRLSSFAEDDHLLAGLPTELQVLHWHGDTYELPDTGVGLASSDRYPNQAFRVGTNAWGLQFHVEVDAAAVARFADAFADEARGAGSEPEQIVSGADAAVAELAGAQDAILGRFAQLVARQVPDSLTIPVLTETSSTF
jgi:GMP synthase-like glutamine amidotransferase